MIISVYSPDYDPNSGYGRMTRSLISELMMQGISVNALGTNNTIINHGDSFGERLMNTPISPSLGGILLGYPTLHKDYGELANLGYKVALTMFESDCLPDGWVDALNRCDIVVVPTDAQRLIFLANGVSVPIQVVPLGISPVYQPAPIIKNANHPLAHYSIKREMIGGRLICRRGGRIPTSFDPFVFLAWGDRDDRKGWDLAIRAFNKVFKHRNDAKLIIKTRANGGGIPYQINIKNVEVISADLSDEEMNDLYLRCDAMVFPSRGEGFGLPPREFSATGGASIVNHWWADDADQWGYPVGYDLVPAWHGYNDKQGLGMWAEADINDLSGVMWDIFSKSPHALQVKGEQTMKWISNQTWSQFTSEILNIWEGVKHASST